MLLLDELLSFSYVGNLAVLATEIVELQVYIRDRFSMFLFCAAGKWPCL
uniref:Uncharacterized protein n=1 Tax=Rhizophora mucronata TaxID=61149 RepID=A0A2P2Q056_RHIMU